MGDQEKGCYGHGQQVTHPAGAEHILCISSELLGLRFLG
jgi:hypothetical protein